MEREIRKRGNGRKKKKVEKKEEMKESKRPRKKKATNPKIINKVGNIQKQKLKSEKERKRR